MLKRTCRLFIFTLILFFYSGPYQVNAANGMPGNPKFGYGARLDLQHQDFEETIETARSVDLDWLAVDYDWSQILPSPDRDPNYAQLDEVMAIAHNQELSVLLSITNPPEWVLSRDGPDPDLTAAIASDLAERYRGTLLAIEPFPGANTQKGWGAEPNPRIYARLIKMVYQALQKINTEIVLVAAGLESTRYGPLDIDDLAFLEALYQQDAINFIPVIGLRLSNISQIPTVPRGESLGRTFRHYEEVRKIMLENNHKNGLIWITGFSWDSASISSLDKQALWLKQAFLLLRAQLYIGTAFVQDLNPFTRSTNITQTGIQHHPGVDVIRQITAYENSRHTKTFDISLYKSSIKKIPMKQ